MTAGGDDLRTLTRRLAELLATEQGTLAIAHLQKLALLAGPREASQEPDAGLLIGIWTPEIQEDNRVAFVRSRALFHEWRYWADVDRIPPKSGPRVVWLGESAARGYLFDPAATPAGVLSTLLGGVDVVDLARTDLGMDALRALFDALPALEPDAVVLFAGNNWHSLLFELDDLQHLADAVRRDGYAGCRRVFLEEILVSRCRSLLDALAESVADFNVPVVVVVPEFNLRDWRAEPSVAVPVLPGDGNLRWIETRRRAEDALAARQLEEAACFALELVSLDGGTSAVGPTILAEVRPHEARAWLERARDAVVGVLVAHSPRCPSAVQTVLRERSAAHGFHVVDLPRVFDVESGGAVPGWDLFLDYCHLNWDGMRIAMTAVAAEVAPLVGAPAPASGLPRVAPEHEATAHLLAAIHNAHYGQSDEVLAYHCSKAAALSMVARDAMRHYLECAARGTAFWLTEAFARLCESPIVGRYLLAPELRSQKLADFRLMETMTRALEGEGVDLRADIERLLKGAHSSEPVDLLDPRYRAFTFRDSGGYALAAERGYLRATDLNSTFALIRAQAGAVRLEITCRTPSGGDVGVLVNGREAGVVASESVWKTSGLAISAREGLNWIDLRWPDAAQPSGELERAAGRLERGIYPEVLPVFGEVHSFWVSGLLRQKSSTTEDTKTNGVSRSTTLKKP